LTGRMREAAGNYGSHYFILNAHHCGGGMGGLNQCFKHHRI
jgi:hypothetical protein